MTKATTVGQLSRHDTATSLRAAHRQVCTGHWGNAVIGLHALYFVCFDIATAFSVL